MVLRNPLSGQRSFRQPNSAGPLSPESRFHARRASLAEHHSTYMRPAVRPQLQLPRDVGGGTSHQRAEKNRIVNGELHLSCGGPYVAFDNHGCTTPVVTESRKFLPKVDEISSESVGGRIRSFRESRGWSQAKLGERLGVSQAAVQKFENNHSRPSERTLIALGNIAGHPECWFFWHLAGLDLELFDREMSKQTGRVDIAESGRRGGILDRRGRVLPMPEQVKIPVLRDAAGAAIPRFLTEKQIETYLGMPAEMCPHPHHTACVRISGSSMSPVVDDGFIAAIDAFTQDIESLRGSMVAAAGPGGVVVVRWLRRSGTFDLLEPQQMSQEHPPIVLTADCGWKVIGEVIWWLGAPMRRG